MVAVTQNCSEAHLRKIQLNKKLIKSFLDLKKVESMTTDPDPANALARNLVMAADLLRNGGQLDPLVGATIASSDCKVFERIGVRDDLLQITAQATSTKVIKGEAISHELLKHLITFVTSPASIEQCVRQDLIRAIITGSQHFFEVIHPQAALQIGDHSENQQLSYRPFRHLQIALAKMSTQNEQLAQSILKEIASATPTVMLPEIYRLFLFLERVEDIDVPASVRNLAQDLSAATFRELLKEPSLSAALSVGEVSFGLTAQLASENREEPVTALLRSAGTLLRRVGTEVLQSRDQFLSSAAVDGWSLQSYRELREMSEARMRESWTTLREPFLSEARKGVSEARFWERTLRIAGALVHARDLLTPLFPPLFKKSLNQVAHLILRGYHAVNQRFASSLQAPFP